LRKKISALQKNTTTQQQCHSEAHQEVAAQVQISEEVEVEEEALVDEEAVVLEVRILQKKYAVRNN